MTQISCPACHAPDPVMLEPGQWECGNCGSRWSDEWAACPSCGTPNAPEAEVCQECGEPLTMLTRVFQRHTKQDTPLWLQQSRRRAPDVKVRAEDGSLARMEALSAIDRVRERAQAEEELKRKERDRQVMAISLVGFLLLVLLGVVAMALVLAK